MKKYLPIIIGAILVVAFAVGYFILSSDKPIEEAGILFELQNDEEINSIVIVNEHGIFSFAQDEEESWYVSSESSNYRANVAKIELLLSSLESFKVIRVLDDESEEYGLSSPSSMVQFATNTGNTYSLAIGNPGADVSNIYVKDLINDTILISDLASVAQLTGGLTAYRDKSVYTVDISNIKRIEYYQQDEYIVGCYNETVDIWYLDYPFDSQARHIELNELVGAMKGWSVAGYPDKDLSLSDMGLETPEESIVITDGDGNTQRIDFGLGNNTVRYARLGGTDDIVEMYAIDIDLSIMRPDTLLFVAPLKCTLDEIESINIMADGKDYTLTCDPASETATLNGKNISYDEFISVFFKYISMVASGRDTKSAAGENIAKFTTVFKDGTTAQLELLERGDDTYYMKINTETSSIYYLKAEKLSKLMERLNVISVSD